jgi:G3E family GTPase
VPVVVLTGHLGSGKTTMLNFLLRRPGARVGVIVNDFGAVNIDAGLVSGQIDEPASIAGGCICCLPDAGGLDDALAKLTQPRLGLDVVIVEASGLAEPTTLARLVRLSPVEGVRPGGVIDVVDAVEYFATLDDGRGPAPLRFEAATLVVVNKLDRVPAEERTATVAHISARVRERNPHVAIVTAEHGRIDPDLIYDAAATEDPPDQLPFAAALRAEQPDEHPHTHARAVTLSVPGAVEPAGIVDLLTDPPPTAYRMKGTITVASRGGPRRYVVHVVGRSVDLVPAGRAESAPPMSEVVAIGLDLDAAEVRRRLEQALVPTEHPTAEGLSAFRRLLPKPLLS